jgi:hypothetical protein
VIISFNTSGDSEAGPIVHMILVLFEGSVMTPSFSP